MDDERTPYNHLKTMKEFTITTDGELLLFHKSLPTWHGIVVYCLMNDNRKLLIIYGLYRSAVVNNLIKSIIRTSCTTCSYSTSGSSHLTSDYDVNISGPSSDMVVEMFNTAFEKRYKQTSAEMFDTNVYGYPRLFDAKTMNLNSRVFAELIRNGKEKYKYVKNPVIPTYQYLNTHNQHIWALVKFLNCVSPHELLTCRQKNYFKEPLQYKENEQKYDRIEDNNVQYASFLKLVKKSVDEIEHAGKDQNELTDQLIIKYNQLVSHANYHGQETYFSTGPYMHVVVKGQMQIDVEITQDQYMDSFIENIGFAISKLTRTSADRCVPVLVDASKYLARAWSAYNNIKNSNVVLKHLEKLYTYRGNPTMPGPGVLLPFYNAVDVSQCNTMDIRTFMFNHAITAMDEYFKTSENGEVQHAHMKSFMHEQPEHSQVNRVFIPPR